jgi:hypothetical protein
MSSHGQHITESEHVYTSMREVKQRALTNSTNETQKAWRELGTAGLQAGFTVAF